MSSEPRTSTPREVLAQAAVKSANNGTLPLVGEYNLQEESRRFRIGSPPVFFENTPYEKGHIAGVYAAFSEGVLVYDFQERVDGYDRDEEVDHVVE